MVQFELKLKEGKYDIHVGLGLEKRAIHYVL